MPPNPLQTGLQALRNLVGAARTAAPSPSQPPAAAQAVVNPVQMVLNKPVTTTTPQLVVAGMAPGSYTFQIFVTDELGVVSKTTSCVVDVR